MKFFGRSALSGRKRNEEILEQLEVKIVDEKLQRYKYTNQTGYDRQQERTTRGCKNNAELQTKWTKMIWRTFEETIRLSRSRFVKASLMTDNDDNDDDDENADFVCSRKKTRRQSKQSVVEVFVVKC